MIGEPIIIRQEGEKITSDGCYLTDYPGRGRFHFTIRHTCYDKIIYFHLAIPPNFDLNSNYDEVLYEHEDNLSL